MIVDFANNVKNKDYELFVGAILAIKGIAEIIKQSRDKNNVIADSLRLMDGFSITIESAEELNHTIGSNHYFVCASDFALMRANLVRQKNIGFKIINSLEGLLIALVGYSVVIKNTELRKLISRTFQYAIQRSDVFLDQFTNDSHGQTFTFSDIISKIQSFMNAFTKGGS